MTTSLVFFGTLSQSVMERFPSTTILISSETLVPQESFMSSFYYIPEKDVNVMIKLTPRDIPVAIKILGPGELTVDEVVFHDIISIPVNSSNPEGVYHLRLLNFDDRDVLVNALVTSDDFSNAEEVFVPLAQGVINAGIIFVAGFIVTIIGLVLFLLKRTKNNSQ